MNALDPIVAAPLYAKRTAVFPRKIDGPFRRFKWLVMAVCLAVYWGTPWIRWDRGPHAPGQAVLVDLAHRRFYMFAIEIWPQEFYFVAGLLIMAGIGLFLVTSAVGRAWCGYACPQTVWTDLYQHVDRLIDGDRNAQLRLNAAPWGAGKLVRRAFKWSVYLGIAFVTGGAWIFYFADAPTLQRAFWTGTAAPVAYAATGILTFTTFWLGGFMREQVCIYMCPWPRIQTAMLDENSLIVTYKHWRGEPRGSLKEAKGAETPLGDCIDCKQCMAVCPTGIDIREGPQIGCITCALCVDACDRAMASVGRPRGLIDYCTLVDAEREIKGTPARSVMRVLLRPRLIAYFAVWGGIGLVLLFMLGARERLTLSVAHERNPEFVQLSGGAVRNAFTLALRNMEDRPRTLRLAAEHLPQAAIYTDDMDAHAARGSIDVIVPADSTARVRLYAVVPAAAARPQEFAIIASPLDHGGRPVRRETHFMAPERHGDHEHEEENE
ncbi:MAG: cytochrome c oxidase accessory protein CcoG [Novosphingobium sp.]|uniref:cytochrome c oxidase accessory protein CcoG n=1 Tax=Novosphingobium sp. TaxID=1874826 RepID=UPI00301AA4E6